MVVPLELHFDVDESWYCDKLSRCNNTIITEFINDSSNVGAKIQFS